MSKPFKRLGNKIKGKKKEEKEDDDDYWNATSQRAKMNFNSDEEDSTDFLVVENQKKVSSAGSSSSATLSSGLSGTLPSSASPRMGASSARQHNPRSARNRGANVPQPDLSSVQVSTAVKTRSSPMANNTATGRSPDSKSDMARLEAENQKLRKQVRQMKTRENYTGDQAVQKTLERFMERSHAPSLENFVSRKDKFALLDKAIERHDGNAITRIIIWLKDTLKRDPNLMKDLMAPERAAGMNHYICYLKEMKEYDELSELLQQLNRPEEAAYLEYQRKIEQYRAAKHRASELESTKRIQFASQRELEFDVSTINEQIRLLEIQPRIIEADKKNKIDVTLKENDTVAQTLWYCWLNHLDPNDEFAPQNLRRLLNISEKEYDWIALTALAKQQMWEMIEKMVKKEEGFLSKFSGPKFETSIELYNLVNILGHYNMPIDKLRKFISAIDDLDERKEIAYRWKDHISALECYEKTQDHQGLAKHLTEIPDDDAHKAICKRYENMVRQSKNW